MKRLSSLTLIRTAVPAAVAVLLATIAATGGFVPIRPMVTIRASVWQAEWISPQSVPPPTWLSNGTCYNMSVRVPAGEVFSCNFRFAVPMPPGGWNLSTANCTMGKASPPPCSNLDRVIVDAPFSFVDLRSVPYYCPWNVACGAYIVDILAPWAGQGLVVSGALIFAPWTASVPYPV